MQDNYRIRRPEGLKVQYRRMRFDFEDQGFARYWHGGSPFKSLFWAQLSTSFDAGERFFIDSARALRGAVKDPKLADELTEFCKQEGHHTAQHLKFDRKNAELGIDIESCRDRYTKALDTTRSKMDALEMLSATVALEHFTSGLAEQYFRNPKLTEGADPKVDALWGWHSAEETEHKGTCYDIYVAAGGGYLRRVMIMPGAWALLLGISLINTAKLLARDRKLFTFDTLKGLVYLFGPRGLVTSMIPAFFAYFNPRFHPWQHNNADSIKRWFATNGRYVAQVDAAPSGAPIAAAS